MLETEAYSCFRRKKGVFPTKNYSPKTYLGETTLLNTAIPFSDIDPEAYAHCHELWGTRHEMVHNGQFKVRKYNGAHGVNKEDLRDFGGFDLRNFRAAALSAVRWLQSL